MRRSVITAAAAAALAAGSVALHAQNAPAPARPAKIDLDAWPVPDVSTVADTPEGRLIKRGHELVTQTYAHIGPEAADPAKRYAGNNLACQSCHLQAGTQPFAMPYTGVWAVFPQYRARENEVSTLEERVNGCMERSMNGRPLPLDSVEMKAMLGYMKWASAAVPVGASVAGAGTKPIKEPNRPADPERGARVYAEVCASCHGDDGQGVRNGTKGDRLGYQFPPLWGPDSYNDGAGMYRLLTAAAFVKHNMPLGTTHDRPAIGDEDAYDVAAFINSRPRPHKANLDKDFPDRLKKPADMPFPPFADDHPADQHKFGPFDPIRRSLKDLSDKAAGKN